MQIMGLSGSILGANQHSAATGSFGGSACNFAICSSVGISVDKVVSNERLGISQLRHYFQRKIRYQVKNKYGQFVIG